MESKNTLEVKVAAYKLIARNSLRMELISPRLSKIAQIEGELKATTECKDSYEHEIKVETYEISKLDKDHPNFEKTKKWKEEQLADYKTEVESHLKAIEDINKEIEEQKKGIAAIESGETKVCLDRLNELVDKMIKQDALSQVK